MSAVVAEIGRIGKAARGTVGVAAIHLETGRRVVFHADESFPMASTVKVAVAAKILDMADKGQINLASPIPVERSEMAPEGPLGDIHWRPGLSFTVSDLLEPMITKSDNTSTDVLYRVAGGPAAVHAYLQALGLKEIYPARTIRELLRDVLSIPAPASPATSLADQFRRMPPKQAAERRAKAYQGQSCLRCRPERSGHPRLRCWGSCARSGWRTVSADRHDPCCIPMMERCTTGPKRIRGRLPAGTVVADKTGTLAGSVNDVGYITLPEGRGHIALVVFVKGSEAPPGTRETVIADIARLVYDSQ